MRILGIDPGYERLGVAILEKNKNSKKELVVFSECFKTSARLEFNERLLLVGEEVEKIIKKYKPKTLAIETIFLHTNQKTAMRVAEIRGMIIFIAKKLGLNIFEASPPQIKNSVTGYGHADKMQVIKMVKLLVEVENKDYFGKESDDELDAMAIALTAFANLKNRNF